LLEHIQTHHDL